jgi:glycosyltransferase involved in cell wall biosynthesis
MIARLVLDKGVREYACAARMVRTRFPHAQFRLVGWIDENPSAISQSELDEWIEAGVIEYLGRQQDVRTALAGCAVYVLPSYREGTPRTVLEAMAVGRAIVTTDAPGCRETVIDGENGFLVPIGDAVALAGAMIRLLENPDVIESFGRKSREMAEKKFDVRIVNHLLTDGMGLSA